MPHDPDSTEPTGSRQERIVRQESTGPCRFELVCSGDGGTPRWPTRVELEWDARALYATFHCHDDNAWATLQQRDDPLWQEEVVEIFLAPGLDQPKRYFEFETNPDGVLFDARIDNPHSRRLDMQVDSAWRCPGLSVRVGRRAAAPDSETRDDWWAELTVPWAGLGLPSPPPLWRANFYRVERPAGPRADPRANPRTNVREEFTAWSPTWAEPPDFHLPQYFGLLVLDGHPDAAQGAANVSEALEVGRSTASSLDPDLPRLSLPRRGLPRH